MPATAEKIRELETIRRARLDADAIASATGRSRRTAERWLAGETAPRGAALAELRELADVAEAFKAAFPKGDLGDWLLRRQGELDYATPAELIAGGDARRVLGLLLALAEGVYL